MNVNNVNSSQAYNNTQLAGYSTFYSGDPTKAQVTAAWKWLLNEAQNPSEVADVEGEEARYEADPSGQPTAQYSITGTLLLNSALNGVDPFQPAGLPEYNLQESIQNMVNSANQTMVEKAALLRAKQDSLLAQNDSNSKTTSGNGVSLLG